MEISKEDIISTIKLNQEILNDQYNVKKIGLFGSFSKNEQTPESDIDLLVEFSKPMGLKFMDLCFFLEELFGRKVDVITIEGLKSIRFNKIREDIKNSLIYVQ